MTRWLAGLFCCIATFARAGECSFAQERVHRMCGWHRVNRKLVAQILQSEVQSLRKADTVLDGLGQIAKKVGHFSRAFQVTLSVLFQQFSRGVQVRVMPDAGEHIQNGPLGFGRVNHSICREQWQAQLLGEVNKRLNISFFATNAVSLQFNIQIVGRKRFERLICHWCGVHEGDQSS